MNGVSAAELTVGDRLLGELTAPAPREKAETMGRLKRVRYTHQAMIDLIIEHPEFSQNQLAAEFGFSAGWVSNILASEAFQAAMAARRDEIIDPELKATIKERFEALARASLDVLMHKLRQPAVSDTVALRAAELGAKAIGIGGHAPAADKVESSADRLERLAKRLEVLNAASKGATINGEARILDVEEVRERVPAAGEGIRDLSGPGSGRDVAGQSAGGYQADGRRAGQDAAQNGGV